LADIITTPENLASHTIVTPDRTRQPDMPRLGEILVAHGVITPKQLESALADQKQNSKYIGVILMRRKWITEHDLIGHLCRQRKVEFYNVHDMEMPLQIYQQIPREIAIKNQVLPIAFQNDKLFVATEDPFDTKMISMLEGIVNKSVSAGFAIRSDLQYALNRIYNNLVRANKNIRDFYDGFAYLLEKPEV
jgi:type IV pilus assembly protein PilB